MALPPDEPTRPLPPTPAGVPPDPAYREVAVATDDPLFRAEVMDRLRDLRAFVVVAMILSLLALAAGAWALFGEDDDRDRNRGSGARTAEVEALEQRIAKLESQRDDKGVAGADFSALADEQAATAAQVEELSAQVEQLAAQQDDTQAAPTTTEDAEARESITALNETVGELDARVQALEQNAP